MTVKEENNASIFVKMNYIDYEGAIVWEHDGISYEQLGTLRQALLNDLWKQHGYPYAELWLLRTDGGGYDFVGPATYVAY